MVKTNVHRNYLQACYLWRAQHNNSFTRAQDELLRAQKEARDSLRHFALRVDCYFAFEHSRLWTQKNAPQTLDADNRLKPCRDALASLLGIDDKFFFSGYFEKVSAPTKSHEGTYIKITPMTPRNLAELHFQIKQETALNVAPPR